jgi:hypothetical protein
MFFIVNIELQSYRIHMNHYEHMEIKIIKIIEIR